VWKEAGFTTGVPVGDAAESGPHYMKARDEYIQRGGWERFTMARTWGMAIATICAKPPASLQTQPSIWMGAVFGPVKWREYDPQQYYNSAPIWIRRRAVDGSVYPLIDRCTCS